MHEHLDLAAAPLCDREDIGNRQFAGENHAPETEFLQCEHTFKVVRDKLRGGM